MRGRQSTLVLDRSTLRPSRGAIQGQPNLWSSLVDGWRPGDRRATRLLRAVLGWTWWTRRGGPLPLAPASTGMALQPGPAPAGWAALRPGPPHGLCATRRPEHDEAAVAPAGL